jgi:Holliday junction resolvase-like predicted endonuclease
VKGKNLIQRQAVGKLGDKAAQKLLRKRGYCIPETGFGCRHGEIDITARQKDCPIFVALQPGLESIIAGTVAG